MAFRRRELVYGGLVLSLAACGSKERAGTVEASQGRARENPGGERLRIATYNVLADPVAVDRRMPALFRELERADADIIALQEVAPWFLEQAGARRWFAGLEPATLDGEFARPNGQSIVARRPVGASRAQRLPGKQGRTLLVSRIALGDQRELAVATTHMESFLEDGPIRAAQLDVIFEELRLEAEDPKVEATVFCGDLNFGDGEEPDTSHLDPDFVDLWLALRPNEPGYTWDIKRSEMARRGSFPDEPSRRLDRVLLRSKLWTPHSIAIIGDAPVEPGRLELFPSDHFGLVAEIERD